MKSIKIWVDDLLLIPAGYVRAKSVNETITVIKEAEQKGITIELPDSYCQSGRLCKHGAYDTTILERQ